jgi:hypothetical protein
MAAMFQAQSANWEETQEKMSQLVSPLALLFVSCSNLSNTYLCPLHRGLFFPSFFLSLNPPQSDPDLHQYTWNWFRSRRRRRQVVYTTSPTEREAAPAQLRVLPLRPERCVLCHWRPLIERVTDLGDEAIGSKIVRRIVIVSSTINHA